ncbi:MAG: DNA topoisomerase 4 subunit A [Lachnospiraceae bacterium]|nr:DNA topoisomerase 4 subunit A [Lachnospiraceae bacterium]
MRDDSIIQTEYSEVMEQSYIDYAMSVIIARALPDVRDGLKPVQRRVLYDMRELGIKYDAPYRKSARIVGDTMGKYHPHGDSSIYEALVVMAQDFKKGMVLVDGHGNFGSIEGDGAAAMRYTEARLCKITQQAFLEDLDKDVVDFIPNFDETEKEPAVLPVKIPNILVNGAEGIAVGMATSIPPHNLGEVIDAAKAYMRDENISTRKLMKYIQGPDFPTGGIVCNADELEEIYETGSGKLRLRGKVEIEKGKGGHTNVVITEIPYTMIGSGIGKFLQDVASLAETKKTNDIVDITNQSSKDGIRIVIELKKDADVENFVNLLYKKTKLEDTFGVNMLAVADGRPETMGLKQILAHVTTFQYELSRRKYTTLLAKEKERREIQEGLIKATSVIDLIIEILRGSKDRAMAKKCLTEGDTTGIMFKSRESKIMAQQLLFTERQANAILEMRLYKLIGLEIEALLKEHDETMANIYRYEDILSSHESMTTVIMEELDRYKKEFSRPRRSSIEQLEQTVYVEKPQEEIELYFLMDKFGYARCIDTATFERNKDAALAENKYICMCKNTGRICVFTDIGQLHTIKVSDLPFGKFRDKGIPIDNVSQYDASKEQVLCVTSKSELNLYRLIFVSGMANMKIVDGGEFDVNKKTVAATKLADGDSLVSVAVLKEFKDVILQSQSGFFLKFEVSEIPEKKKGAVGVRGMKLEKDDMIESVYYTIGTDPAPITYKDKNFDSDRLRLAKRDGKGTKIRI